jgi:hypothetical protein
VGSGEWGVVWRSRVSVRRKKEHTWKDEPPVREATTSSSNDKADAKGSMLRDDQCVEE